MCLLRDYSVYIATRIPEGIRIHVHDVTVTSAQHVQLPKQATSTPYTTTECLANNGFLSAPHQ